MKLQNRDELKISATEVINTGKYKYGRTNLAFPGPVGGPCLIKDTYILNESLKNKKSNQILHLQLEELMKIYQKILYFNLKMN